MAALDTKVLVRWLVNDDAAQTAAVERLVHTALADKAPLFITTTVLLETERVLRSRYRFERAAFTLALDAMLSVPELALQDESAVEQALWFYRQEGAPDFADCLHLGVTSLAGQGPLLTFDVRAARLEGAQLLG